jgi:hypothetical protein
MPGRNDSREDFATTIYPFREPEPGLKIAWSDPDGSSSILLILGYLDDYTCCLNYMIRQSESGFCLSFFIRRRRPPLALVRHFPLPHPDHLRFQNPYQSVPRPLLPSLHFRAYRHPYLLTTTQWYHS